MDGYDQVPATLPAVSGVAGAPEGKRRIEGRLREILNGAGYTEVINYSFIAPDSVDKLGLDPTDQRRNQVRIKNPLSEEQSVMRTTMAYSLLLNARRNRDVDAWI
jgi:phenylalanyl-tRNA synthetase beta chain